MISQFYELYYSIIFYNYPITNGKKMTVDSCNNKIFAWTIICHKKLKNQRIQVCVKTNSL